MTELEMQQIFDKQDSKGIGVEKIDDLIEFGIPSRVHDWRNHIPDEALENWENLSLETKLFLYIAAERDAHNEEWD